MQNVMLIAKQVFFMIMKSWPARILFLIVLLLTTYAAYTGYQHYATQKEIMMEYQQKARKSWEKNPDKHPHRMAHYGSFAFRTRHPLSFFDFGMESYTGNTVFLEAHKQNSVNFSEAGFSSGTLRFGEISMAVILQTLFPLFIFFLGFGLVATERENGTLRLLLIQTKGWKQVILGKTLGLFAIGILLFIPVLLTTIWIWTQWVEVPEGISVLSSILMLLLMYVMYIAILSAITIAISASSKTAKRALLQLIGCWIIMVIMLPRGLQALGSGIYPTPAKQAFEAAVEKEIIKMGDSHNPDDPHFRSLKDSILKANGADSIQQLPFNYSGVVMREGERMSAEVYAQQIDQLWSQYRKQNQVTSMAAFINPFIAIRDLSMILSGTDFEAYTDFQKQAETYRYELAQKMNELQIKYISNKKLGPDDDPYSISSDHWKEMPDFHYRFLSTGTVFQHAAISLIALCVWFFIMMILLYYLTQKLKAV